MPERDGRRASRKAAGERFRCRHVLPACRAGRISGARAWRAQPASAWTSVPIRAWAVREKLGLRIAKPPCVPVSHPKNQSTDMVDGGEGRHVSASANTSTTTVRPAGNATPDITTRLVQARSAVDAGQ